jgi:hypothetical protein
MLRSAGRPVVIGNAVVATITLTSVLIIYDGWATLKFGDVAAIIVGPVLAIFVAHAFAGVLEAAAAKGRPLSRSELLGVVTVESGFLLLALPPLALLAVLALAGVSLGDGIRIVIWLGAASLGFWGGLAGVRAGLRGWRLALAVAVGLLVGALVLALKVVLQPGKAASHGVALVIGGHDQESAALPVTGGRERQRCAAAGTLSITGRLSRGCERHQRT